MLFIAPRYLLPADSGGKIRTSNVLKGLKDGAFEVTVVSPAPADATSRDAESLAQICDHYSCWPENFRGPLFPYLRARHLLSRLPVPVESDKSIAAKKLILSELKKRPDVVVVDFPHTAILIPPQVIPASVLFTHNVEAHIFERHLAVAKNPFKRFIWKSQLEKMRAFEYSMLRNFDAVIAVSDQDKALFKKDYGVVASVIPTGVDLDFFEYRSPKQNNEMPQIVFTASMDSYANVDGIQWFMDDIWPLIARSRPDASITIVGRSPNPRLLHNARDRKLPWTFTAFVDDVRPYIHNATVYMIPLRVGSGTRIKAYEAMASGCPVVSTTVGVEGLPLKPNQHYLSGDTPDDFAESVLQLLRDYELRKRIAREARNLVEENFSAKRVAKVFEEICLKTIASFADPSEVE